MTDAMDAADVMDLAGKNMVTLALTSAQRDALLGSLNLLHKALKDGTLNCEIETVVTNYGENALPTPDEIDGLAEAINGGSADVTLKVTTAIRAVNEVTIAMLCMADDADDVIQTS
ncbi:hypothetical protein F1188_15970 [Roseospira marina]|uniref:Uncharacterized protein n=1 Tax=Roseospira marina TaxID=140057 RepID=A0A5M6I8U8_9PROT|nr:hypothetical protein [Roseospira marina]KAA5604357.1 hypothetical protein F1188_15970 [Roseospira marina]MBB4315457.1 hypothetical protein [Roseospira marina]MBB5088397.1 hypothetical protein [Roseospira marina]